MPLPLLNSLYLQTSAGPLSLVGRLHTGGKRPVLLAMRGAFPTNDLLHDLVDRFSGANVIIATIPGMADTLWAESTPASLARGLDEALRQLPPDCPVVAYGSSAGNLVTLGLQSPSICHFVADEPFFQTKDLWPFIANSRERMNIDNVRKYVRPFLWNYFGIGPDTVENRDYRYLIDGIKVPTDVIVGESPLLPERDLSDAQWPSFTSDQDRAYLLLANAFVTLHHGPQGSGHGLGATPVGAAQIRKLLHAALHRAAKLCA